MKWFILVLLSLCTASQAADWSYATPIASPITTNATIVLKLASVNARNYVTGVQLYNTSASVATIVTIKDGTTVLWTGYLPLTSATLQIMPIEIEFKTPLRGSVNTAMNLVINTTGAAIFASAQGFSGN